MGNRRTVEHVVPSDNAVVLKDTVVVKDTVIQIVKEPEQLKKQSQETKIVIDFDNGMSSFIPVVEDAIGQLSEGTLSTYEIIDLDYDVTGKYYTAYDNVLNESKAKYPEISGIDVELEVARASEKSRTSRLFQQFIKAKSDTIKGRQGE